VEAERLLAGALAWLATFAVHGLVLCAAAWAIASGFARFGLDRERLAAARERLWKLAIFGGLATATLASIGAGPTRWRVGIEEFAISDSMSLARFESPSGPYDEGEALAAPTAASTPSVPKFPAIPVAWTKIAGAFWIAGIALGSLAWMRDRRRLARSLRGCTRIDSGPAFEAFERIERRARGKRSRRIPELWRAPHLLSPLTFGIARPTICIPPRAQTDLMPEELEALLAHELAHVHRRDPLLLALCRAVEIVLFVQPLTRLGRMRLLDQAEILCDERAANKITFSGSKISNPIYPTAYNIPIFN
jgi:Zn-dependent protease with chaperone function